MSDFIGKHQLGYKESGTNEEGLLGVEWEVVDADYGQQNILDLNPTRVQIKWVKNTGSSAIVPGTVVVRDTAYEMAYAVKAVSAANELGYGICDPSLTSNVAQDEKFFIIRKGSVDVKSGAAIAKGVPVGVGAAGVASAAGNPFGVLTEAATAAGQLRRADVDFTNTVYTTAQSITADDSDSALNQILPSSTQVSVAGVTNNANDYVVLPALASVPDGHRITVIGNAGSNFEVRTAASSAEEINSENCDGTKEYLFTSTQIHYFTKISNTVGWMGNGFTAIGAVATAVVPD